MSYIELSYTFSILSILFYSVVYAPQFYIIYKTKSSEGISIWMLLLWTQADILSLIGTILLSFELEIILIGWYHFIIGIIMIIYVLIYEIDRNITKLFSAYTFIGLNLLAAIICNIFIKEQHIEVGSILGWFTMSLYILGRIPQIYLNIKRNTTEGLSILMYILTICGNACYIIVLILDSNSIKTNLPWLVSTIGIIFLDIVVLLQHEYYKKLEKIKNH